MITWTFGVLALALVGTWAWRAPQYKSADLPTFNAPANAQGTSPRNAPDQPLDTTAFNIALWNPPPPAPPPEEESKQNKTTEQPPAPPSQLDVQLVAIVRDGDQRRAALYDASTERLAIFAEGQALESGPVVTAVTDVHVDLEASGRRYRLTLRAEDRS